MKPAEEGLPAGEKLYAAASPQGLLMDRMTASFSIWNRILLSGYLTLDGMSHCQKQL